MELINNSSYWIGTGTGISAMAITSCLRFGNDNILKGFIIIGMVIMIIGIIYKGIKEQMK